MRHLVLATALLVLAPQVSLADKGASDAALGGYCPVAYAEMNQAVKGDPKISAEHDGKQYLFANADAKKMFEADPAKYQVAYDGWCATAVSMGKKLKSDPTLFTVADARTYLFSSADAKKMFDGDSATLASKADAEWMALNPALGGYCPVAYAVMQKAIKGDPKLALDSDGKRYLFANADARKMFQADPSKYRVAYDGWCATAISMGKKVASDPKRFKVSNGVTYLFSSADAQKMFEADGAGIAMSADARWASLR